MVSESMRNCEGQHEPCTENNDADTRMQYEQSPVRSTLHTHLRVLTSTPISFTSRAHPTSNYSTASSPHHQEEPAYSSMPLNRQSTCFQTTRKPSTLSHPSLSTTNTTTPARISTTQPNLSSNYDRSALEPPSTRPWLNTWKPGARSKRKEQHFPTSPPPTAWKK